jgi:hypothetical protein
VRSWFDSYTQYQGACSVNEEIKPLMTFVDQAFLPGFFEYILQCEYPGTRARSLELDNFSIINLVQAYLRYEESRVNWIRKLKNVEYIGSISVENTRDFLIRQWNNETMFTSF